MNAYSSTASVYGGVTNVPGALNSAGAAIDILTTSVSNLSSTIDGYGNAVAKSVAETFDASAATLPTCSAVAGYVSTAAASAVTDALTWITV